MEPLYFLRQLPALKHFLRKNGSEVQHEHTSLRTLIVITTLCFAALLTSAQTAPTAISDPQAVALATKALVALRGGAGISDAILSGTAIRIVGGDRQSGAVTIKLKGTGESRMDLSFSSTLSEVRNDISGQSFFQASDQKWHPMALHNCSTDASWLFPALSSLSAVSNPKVLFTYVGQEARNGLAVQHIRVSRPEADPLFTHLSTMEFYLDANSLLPIAISFAAHPDTDELVDIPAEVRFADYRNVNGVLIPFRVQKLLQNSLLLDLTLTNASINVGLQDSDFVVAAQ